MSYHFLCPLPEVEFTKEKTTATCSLIYGDSIKNSGHLNGNEQTDLKFACHHPWAFSNPTVRPHLHPFNQFRRKGPSSVPVAMIFLLIPILSVPDTCHGSFLLTRLAITLTFPHRIRFFRATYLRPLKYLHFSL
jgi:hypothetical protein